MKKLCLRIRQWWSEVSPENKRLAVRLCGIALAFITLFALIACLSYFFTWKADRSLAGNPDKFDMAVEVYNIAGKTGASWSDALMGRWFGLGAFVLIALGAVLSVRMITGKRLMSAFKAFVLGVSGALLLSYMAAYVSVAFGLTGVFGYGLGGRSGGYAVLWASNLIGVLPSVILLVLLCGIWFFFLFRKGAGSVPGSVSQNTDDEGHGPADESDGGNVSGDDDGGMEAEAEDGLMASEDNPGTTEGPQPGEVPQEDALHHDGENAPVNGGDAPQEPENPGLEIQQGEEISTQVYADLPRIDIRDELPDYRFPPLELLEEYENARREVSEEELKRNNFKIRATLKNYKIEVDNVKAVVGPTVTLYKVYPAPGVKISAIRNLHEDIAMALHAKGVRVVTLSDSVGVEVANDHPSLVPLRALLNDEAFRSSKAELPVAIGYTITQKVKVFDLADAPHLLVAGATKQGKSVGLNVLINSLLYSKHPSELKFVFIDPKRVEFSAYARLLKHYLAVLPDAADSEEERQKAISKDAKQAELVLNSLCVEMDARYKLLESAMVSNIKDYNERYRNRRLLPSDGHHFLPYMVVVVDEYADLTMSVGKTGESKATARSISDSIIRLAQKGRAAGIHVVLATQRPSVDVITGMIKANFPARIAFRVFSMVDSRTILDSPGADKLIGKGDMIYYAGADMERVQCGYISSDEINTITGFIGGQTGYKKSYSAPYYLPAPETEQTEDGVAMVDMKQLDDRFEEAARQIVMSQRGSTSDLQRKLGMGYAKAGRVMDQLEAAGIVGPQEGSKPRQVLVSSLAELDDIIAKYKNGDA